MKFSTIRLRRWILAALIVAVMVVFVARLVNIQIVDSAMYKKMVEGGYVSTQTVKAVRGEIVDRNGQPLAVNRMGFDVIVDKAFFPSDRQNEIILKLINLLEELGEDWNDLLPITETAPYTFKDGYEGDVEKLKAFLGAQPYATVEDVIFWLTERYELEKYSPQDARRIASVRYEMERRGFAVNVPYTFASDIQMSSVIPIKERGRDLAGVDVVENAIRQYPNGTIAPHIIGTIGAIYAEEYPELKKNGYLMDDIIGKNGIEREFESQLRGKNGKREIYISLSGEVIEAAETIAPTPGNTVSLTLDMELQRIGQEALARQIKYLQDTAPEGEGKEANAGSAVMLNAKTGEVLAMVTYPSYDLSTYRQDYSTLIQDTVGAPLLNRALNGKYAPGSTFKPVVALAGLSSGVIDAHSTVNCTRVYTFYPDYPATCLGYHGLIDVNRALSVSCNIFFYDVGRRTGITTINDFAAQLGLGESTGIQIPEYIGQRSDPEVKKAQMGEVWYPGDVIQSAIGQLLNQYSTLQLANYAATLGNRGQRMQVSIVKEIRDYSMDTVVEAFDPVVADRVDAPDEAFETVIAGMVTASRSGTAIRHFGNYPVDVASKTGTPQTPDYPNSVFIAFAPAEDPQVAIAVIIEKGWHGYTGAPVAKELFDAYFGYDKVVDIPLSGESSLPEESASSKPESQNAASSESEQSPAA
ncbi:penicillin-binding transpeptidase domain-containing protein [Oscillospiraceae bacterium MB08-C2-2]|nr:penicillin-binding transpeptidase domain-containing protein [Oscillospiraceae bacterium MB08-C2-2]